MKQINNFFFNDNAEISTLDEEIKFFLIQDDNSFYTQAINTSLIESIKLFRDLDYKSSKLLIKNVFIIINNNIDILLDEIEKEIENIEKVSPSSNEEERNKKAIQFLCDEILDYKFYIEENNDSNTEVDVDLNYYGIETFEDLDNEIREIMFNRIVNFGVFKKIFTVGKNGIPNLTPNSTHENKDYLQ